MILGCKQASSAGRLPKLLCFSGPDLSLVCWSVSAMTLALYRTTSFGGSFSKKPQLYKKCYSDALNSKKKMLEERGKTVIDGPLEETPGRDGNERKYSLKKKGGRGENIGLYWFHKHYQKRTV